ncbi:MAG: oligoendopeptidase F [Firmicutes bacterium]|nr:oligoendopeptidase F [Bacillota bacterium]
MTKQLKQQDVQEKHRWRLEDIYASPTEWEEELQKANKDSVKVLKFKGKLSSADGVLEAYAFCDDFEQRLEKLYCYAMLASDRDLADSKFQEYRTKAYTLMVKFNSAASFMNPELSKLEESFLQELIQDSRFSAYTYRLEEIIKNKKYILSEAEERILALAGKTLAGFKETFSKIDNVDLKFPTITVDGEKHPLTHATYAELLSHPNQELRKKAFRTLYKTYEGVIHTLCANFGSSINKDNFLATVKGYKSALDLSLTNNDVPSEVYGKLLSQVDENLPAMHDYMEFRKKQLKLEEIHMYDLHVALFEDAELRLDYEGAYDLMLEALKPMGEEYLQLLTKARKNRWIDVEETENKRSGAYSCGVYGVHPFVLLNYKPTTHDVFTLAHEMGHALHSFYSSKNQPYAKNDYSIFVAEVASTVNEVLLLKHLQKTVTDEKIKRYLLSYYLDMFRTTLFRQTMFAEFEREVHTKEQAGTPLTVDYLSKYYLKLNKKYYGSAVSVDRQIKYEWARIPHFYSAYYVYQYATGITSAVTIANGILSGDPKALERYKQFLSAGGHKSPYEILKDAGVDLLTDQPYKVAFGEFKSALKELKKLC